ncbi:putative Trichome birefringence-like 21 [Capsicum annuum]|nr:putative Trichome birefringence-like 21 [Capsicum annuum]
MAGLLAWAADVVGGGKSNEEDDNPNSIPLIFTPQQQSYLIDLDRKATSLTRTIQDLRLRLPPPDISERLPHLHAHSLASNNALALQLNAHSATKEQAQLREITLQEENAEYDKAISDYENKIQVKSQEADLLRSKLQEMALVEENLRSELERAQAAAASESVQSNDYLIKNDSEAQEDEESANSALLRKLEEKKKELTFMEEAVHDLEKKWTEVQDYALKQPCPVFWVGFSRSVYNIGAFIESPTRWAVTRSGGLRARSGWPGPKRGASRDQLGRSRDQLGSIHVWGAARWALTQSGGLGPKRGANRDQLGIAVTNEDRFTRGVTTQSAQREKILDKQLHSLIEQLASKQAQAEGLANEVHLKEMELERLNGLWRKLEADADTNATRNRGRQKPGRLEKLHKLMLLSGGGGGGGN